MLPETWQFLGGMWWVLHLVAVAVVFLIGMVIGYGMAKPEPDPVNQDEQRRKEAERSNA